MTETNNFDRQAGIRGPLLDLLTARLPLYCGNNGLQVHRLARSGEMTPQGIYRWLKSGKITPSGALKLSALSQDIENQNLLPEGIPPARTEDFSPFVFA